MSLAERLKAAREHLRRKEGKATFSQTRLAERTGGEVGQQMISKLETGKSKETAQIGALARACGVEAEWLEKGTGPMVREPPPDPDVLEIAQDVKAMPPNWQFVVRAMLHSLVRAAPWNGQEDQLEPTDKPPHHQTPEDSEGPHTIPPRH